MPVFTPGPRVTRSNGVRRGETFVTSGDGVVPESTFSHPLGNLKSVFRPHVGRKEEFSW